MTVFETSSCGANFDGEDYRIWKDFTLDSAVRFKNAPVTAPEIAVHGHTFTLRLHLSAPIDDVMGWIIDFGDVKRQFDPILRSLDHHAIHLLSEGPEDSHTGAIANWVQQRAVKNLPHLARVDLYEAEGRGSVATTECNFAALSV